MAAPHCLTILMVCVLFLMDISQPLPIEEVEGNMKYGENTDGIEKSRVKRQGGGGYGKGVDIEEDHVKHLDYNKVYKLFGGGGGGGGQGEGGPGDAGGNGEGCGGDKGGGGGGGQSKRRKVGMGRQSGRGSWRNQKNRRI